MSLAFQASQKIDLPVQHDVERLSAYLLEQERVVGAMLDAKKLTLLEPGRFRYAVTSLQVFQLQVNPVVSIEVVNFDGKIKMTATDSELKGLGLVDDFDLTLDATLEATPKGLEGEAVLAVSVTVCRLSNSWVDLILNMPPVVTLLVFMKVSFALPSDPPMVIAAPPAAAAILKLFPATSLT